MSEERQKQALGGGGARAEIDTSAPFESVKEAANRFGGIGFWRPALKPAGPTQTCDAGEIDVAQVEEQAAELERELILKEKDTLEVLKELEATKMIVEELKSKLQREESAVQLNADAGSVDEKLSPLSKEEEEVEDEKENNPNLSLQKMSGGLSTIPSSAPGLILMELKQAKLNLTKTTGDLAEIRASVELYNKKIERERISLEKTRERLRSNSEKVSSIEEEISRTKSKLEEGGEDDGKDVTAEIQRLSVEAEQFKKMGESAKSEVIKVMLDIEQTKAKIKTAEIRLVAAKKMKEAARAAEAVALAEIKALEKSGNEQNPDDVTLTFEEYSSLRTKALDVEESCNSKVLEAMAGVDGANESTVDIMERVEAAMEEVKTSKQALEEALGRVEAANRAKLAVEEALRKWRSDHGERRRSIQNSTKLKNPYPSQRRRELPMLDLNGVELVGDVGPPILKPTLSIGQILSRKLLITEEFESGKSSLKRKISLGQMLGKQNSEMSSAWKVERDGGAQKKLPAKRKKFGFARFSVLLNKQNKKKKKPATPTSRLNFLTAGCKGEQQEVNQFAVLKK